MSTPSTILEPAQLACTPALTRLIDPQALVDCRQKLEGQEPGAVISCEVHSKSGDAVHVFVTVDGLGTAFAFLPGEEWMVAEDLRPLFFGNGKCPVAPSVPMTVLTGNTYPVRKQLAKLGASWDGKRWSAPDYLIAEAKEIIAGAGDVCEAQERPRQTYAKPYRKFSGRRRWKGKRGSRSKSPAPSLPKEQLLIGSQYVVGADVEVKGAKLVIVSSSQRRAWDPATQAWAFTEVFVAKPARRRRQSA